MTMKAREQLDLHTLAKKMGSIKHGVVGDRLYFQFRRKEEAHAFTTKAVEQGYEMDVVSPVGDDRWQATAPF